MQLLERMTRYPVLGGPMGGRLIKLQSILMDIINV